MKRLIAATLAASMLSVNAGVYCSGYTAHFSVSVPTATEIQGRPGGTAVWIMNPAGTDGAYLSSDGRWIYSSTPAYADYRPRLSQPAVQTISACVPDFSYATEGGELACASHTFFAGGWQIWSAVGGFTAEAEQRVNQRENRINEINAQLIAQGRSPRTFDRQRWIESEIARDGRNRAAVVLTIPGGLDCRPPETGN